MMSSAPPTFLSLSLSLVLVGACGSDAPRGPAIAPTLRLADRSDGELRRLMDAARFGDAFLARFQLDIFANPVEGDPCPQLDVAGTKVTVIGGCTRVDGEPIEGAVSVDNPSGWPQVQYEASRDTHYDFDQFALERAGVLMDGAVHLRGLDEQWADVTVTVGGLAVRTAATLRCPSPQRCDAVDGGIELPGIGGVVVSGTTALDPTANLYVSDYRLEGVDVLVFHDDGAGCLAWHIEGSSRGVACP